MLNIMKADLYRCVRGKAFWITLVVLVLFLVVMGISATVGTMGLANAAIEDMPSIKAGSWIQLSQMATADNLFYFFLPIFAAVISTDFTHGTVKNVLSKGCSRTTYYLAKLFLSLIVCCVLIVVYETVPFLVGTALYGVGDYFKTYNPGTILLTQIPIYFAVVSLGCFIALSVKKTAVLNSVYISMFIVTQILIITLVNFFSFFGKLAEFELGMAIRKFVFVENITTLDILSNSILAIIVILVTTIAGIILFRKSEIK